MRTASTNHERAALDSLRSGFQPQPATDEISISAAARQRRRRRVAAVYTTRVALLIVVIGGWQLFTQWKIVDPFFFGQPSGVVSRLFDWVEHGTAFGSLWLQVGTTMKEAALGFLYGVGSGVFLGFLLGRVRFLADVIGPYIKVVNSIPRIVLGSIFLIAFGLGTTSKVLLAAVLVFFGVFFNAFQGAHEVDGDLVANVRVLGASRLQVVRHVVVPSAVTWVLASLHVAFGFAIIGAVVGEFLGAQKGLGLVIANAQNNFDANGIFGAMLIIAIVTLLAELLLGRVEHRLLAWRPQTAGRPNGP